MELTRSGCATLDMDIDWMTGKPKISRQISLTLIEKKRLAEINGRSTRLDFTDSSKLPSLQTILDLSPHILGIVVAKSHAPSCFCIFADKKRKEVAEKRLDGRGFQRGLIVVDTKDKLVPVDANDLDNSREVCTLAVHGIGRDVTEKDLRRTFPGLNYVRIARRGGSAFLTYRRHDDATRAFLKAENTWVRGYKVQVLFSHTIAKEDRVENEVEILAVLEYSRPSDCPKDKSVFKSDIAVQLTSLHRAGLGLEQLQDDFLRKGLELSTELEVKAEWMERLRRNSDKLMSASNRKALVDNVWQFLEKDASTQRKMRMAIICSEKDEARKEIIGENSPKGDDEHSKRKGNSSNRSPERKKQKNEENNTGLCERFRKYCYVKNKEMDTEKKEGLVGKLSESTWSSKSSLKSSTACATGNKSLKKNSSEKDKNNNAKLCDRFRQYCNILDAKKNEARSEIQKNVEPILSLRPSLRKKKDRSDERHREGVCSVSKTNIAPQDKESKNTSDVSNDILDIDNTEIEALDDSILDEDDVVDDDILDEEVDDAILDDDDVNSDKYDDDILDLILDEEEQSELLKIDTF